jgi:hypothetical protein
MFSKNDTNKTHYPNKHTPLSLYQYNIYKTKLQIFFYFFFYTLKTFLTTQTAAIAAPAGNAALYDDSGEATRRPVTPRIR